MTAINAFLRRERGFLMTDGAFYDETGMPLGFGSKVFAIPNLNAVIAARGFAGICPLIAPNLSVRFASFDEMVENVEPDLVRFADENAQHLEAVGFPDFELHIMGWSEKHRRPRHFMFGTREQEDEDDDPPFTLVENDSYVVAPPITDDERFRVLPQLGVFLGMPEFTEDMKTKFDPVLHGVPIMQAQRRSLDTFVGRDGDNVLCSVGGHIAVAEVGPDGVSQRILHRWPDVAGQPATPTTVSAKNLSEQKARFEQRNREVRAARGLAPAVGAPPSGMNRQQRRLWERKHGKVVA